MNAPDPTAAAPRVRVADQGLLIRGALLADGTGAEPDHRDVLVTGDRVAAVEPPGRIPDQGRRVVDATGQVLAPGFVDVHSHSDNAPLYGPGDLPKLLQGVTTEVVGNCGFSLAPFTDTRQVRDYAAVTFPPELPFTWRGFADLFKATDAAGYITNYVPLVGHGTVRSVVCGGTARPARAEELREMGRAVAEACDAGCFGLSSGLAYSPGSFADTAELTSLVRHMPRHGIYASHIRSEGPGLLDSLREAVRIGHETGRRVQISHLKVPGRGSPDRAEQVLGLLRRARREGLAVAQDVYPYTAASLMLSACLPQWAHDGGGAALLTRLADPRLVERMRAEVEEHTGGGGGAEGGDWDNHVASAGYRSIRVASTATGTYDGQALTDLAAALGMAPFDTLVHIVRHEENRANMIVDTVSDDDIAALLRDEHTMLGTDGAPPGWGTSPHPRVSGTFPRLLRRFVRDLRVLSLPAAVARMTSLPADTFGLADRGRVRVGAVADLVIFDPQEVQDRATYDSPLRPPEGIGKVLVGGQVVVDGGRWTGRRTGARLTPG
ncbi:amidohydrolase family protein [Streptomyces sp. NPDC005970]|uniref:N-acyl-D-amino-acid deacylase family protein n=1 Tax=Streptomyces sp. NPDC005970 TaxID=3156723 RepID=UPI0033DC7700